jgi:hypothetical protein
VAAGWETGTPVSESERQLIESGRIRLENVNFETNSATLLPESESALREAGEALEILVENTGRINFAKEMVGAAGDVVIKHLGDALARTAGEKNLGRPGATVCSFRQLLDQLPNGAHSAGL